MAKKMREEQQHGEFSTEDVLGVLEHFVGTDAELHGLIDGLIEHRERLRGQELTRLQAATAKALQQLKDNRHKALVEEIACFKDVLTLHQKLRGHGRGRH